MLQKKIVTPEKALEKIETLCAKSERCTDEVRRKLITWGIPSETREEIIESLQRRRFIDDTRFAKAYVRDKWQFNHWGRRKIMAGLASKHITGEIARTAIEEEIDADAYYEKLCSLAINRLRRYGDIGYEQGTKALRTLVAAGYETTLAARAIREAATAISTENAEDE